MSYKRLDPEDIVISSDSLSSVLWSTDSPTLTNFYTSSIEVAANQGAFYYNIFATTSSTADVEFSIAFGQKFGSGSENYNQSVDGMTPSRTMYGQYRNLVYGDETKDFVFGDYTSNNIFIITPDRARYKQALLPGSLNLKIGNIQLTDDSKVQQSTIFNDAGRVYNLVSGSNGAPYSGSGYSNSGSYGMLLPDIGTIILNADAFSAISLNLNSGSVASPNATNNMSLLYNQLVTGANFRLNSEETVTADYVFVRARAGEFNYSENPSFIGGDNGSLIWPIFVNNPQTYITTVGLYNDANELLAVAKLSRPLSKDFTKELLLRVKLSF